MQERRQSPRYLLSWSAVLAGRGGGVFDAEVREISTLGISVELSRAAVTVLAQSASVLMPGDQVSVRLLAHDRSVLPADIVVPGRVQHARRLSFDRYHVGLTFVPSDPLQLASLPALLEFARREGMK